MEPSLEGTQVEPKGTGGATLSTVSGHYPQATHLLILLCSHDDDDGDETFLNSARVVPVDPPVALPHTTEVNLLPT